MLTFFQNIFGPPRDLMLLLAAAWLGMTLSEKRAGRYSIKSQDLDNLIFAGSVAYVLGGRLLYAAEHLSAFAQSPVSLISLNLTLFDNWGGLAIATIAGLVYGQRKKLSFWPTLDSLSLFFASIALGLGLSHLASGSAFGRETNLPWGINLWGAQRHPTQIYEILDSLAILGLLWFRKAGNKPGGDFLLFAALTAGSRLLIEAFRGDSTLVFGNLRAAQIVAWLALAASLIGLEVLKTREIPLVVDPEPAPTVRAKPQKAAPKKQKVKAATQRPVSAQRARRKEAKNKTRHPK